MYAFRSLEILSQSFTDTSIYRFCSSGFSCLPHKVRAEEHLAHSEKSLSQAFALHRKSLGNEYEDTLIVIGAIIRRIVASKITDPTIADEVYQEALLSIHQSRESYDARKEILPWINAITRFKIIDAFRQLGKLSIFTELTLELQATCCDTHEQRIVLQQILQTLPEDQRELMSYIKLEGNSVREAAERFQLTESAVKVTVHRTLKQLRDAFSK